MKLKGIELKGTYKIIYYNTSFLVYDEKGNQIYYEKDNGFWSKSEYDRRGNRTYYEDSYGYWFKGYGYWFKSEYDEKDNEIYLKNKNGEIIDKRVKELTIEQIEKLLGYKIKIKGERK